MDLKEVKRELLLLRDQLKNTDQGLSESLGVSLEDEGGDESLDQHPADVGTVTLSREIDLSVQGDVEHLLGHVERALEKIDEGTYGLCDRCGQKIEVHRLEAVPYATLCMTHQKERERSEQRETWEGR